MEKSKTICQEKVFKDIYDKKVTLLHNFIYFKSGNSVMAQDIVQNAFIKLWENCKKVPFEKANAFLYKVSNNLFLNEVAHKKVVLKYEQTATKTFNIESPEYIAEEKEFMKKLQQAIAELTSEQREAFLLNRIEGKKYKEIAEMLNISVKAVEKRMHKALLSLKKKIGDQIAGKGSKRKS